jgi:hypothetical protein
MRVIDDEALAAPKDEQEHQSQDEESDVLQSTPVAIRRRN